MDNINELLDESDRIKNLSDEAVKDIWVRKQLWEKEKRKYMSRLGSDAYEDFMSELKADESGGSLYGAIRRVMGIQVQSQINKSDKSAEEFLFDKWINSDIPEDLRADAVRRDLDKAVSGGCGMPVHEVIRSGLKSWDRIENKEVA